MRNLEDLPAGAILRAVFDEATTQAVMLNPTEKTRQEVVELVATMSVAGSMRAMGTVVGKAVADVLEAAGLRAADYGFLPDVSEQIVRRIVSGLQGEEADVFVRALNEYLGMRG